MEGQVGSAGIRLTHLEAMVEMDGAEVVRSVG